ncbi:glycosyltransferase [Spirosoma sp. SC4-14]|uniref:glycosyltransferase n=1 Tax=Spirosoma sp. SC4-14 TaxID=3128900 RepID=UPI0030D481F2
MMMLSNKVAAAVVMYNPEEDIVENISSYINQVERIYVIDNSEIHNENLIRILSSYASVSYYNNEGNKGVAAALNRAAQLAIDGGYQFLLTMDDDTQMPEDGVKKMLQYIMETKKKIGIVAAQSDPRFFYKPNRSVYFTITSGNLLNLSAYKKNGPFLDELFIDYVDHEFCFRLIMNGYAIIELNEVCLQHKLGEIKEINLGPIKVKWTSHSPLRVYYKTRNCFYVLKKYRFLPITIRMYFYKDVLRDLVKIFFLEDEKFPRIILYVKAIRDAFFNDLGKLELTKNA